MRAIDRILSALSLSASLATTACGGSSPSSPCAELATCCATLAGSDAQACTAAVSQSGVTESVCAAALSTYQSAGECSLAGSDAGVTFEGGVSATGCAGLAACCPSLPVAQDPSECMEVASNGTTEACDTSLAAYQATGFCGTSTACITRSLPVACAACISANCGPQLGAVGGACGALLACFCVAPAGSGPTACVNSVDTACSSALSPMGVCEDDHCASECNLSSANTNALDGGSGGSSLVDGSSGGVPAVSCTHGDACQLLGVDAENAATVEEACVESGGTLGDGCPAR